MSKIYLICDESGSKGFSDNAEKFEGEFGLFAGYFLTEDNIGEMKIVFETIYKEYSGHDGKLHITDLDETEQRKLRTVVFEGDCKMNCAI
jgi:hypothetical protein